MENHTETQEAFRNMEYPVYDSVVEKTTFFKFAKYATVYLQPTICTVGLLGNMLSFCVFCSASLRKISSNIYLAALSASSYGFNMVMFFQWLEMVDIPIIHTQGFCQAIVYFSFVFSFLSVWLIVCITVENFIVTFFLSKAVTYCTVFRARIVILILVLYSVLIYSGHIWTTNISTFGNYTICTEEPEYSKINRIFSFLDTITTLIIPIIVTVVLIVAILSKNLLISRATNIQTNSIYRHLSKTQKSLVRITRVLLAISLTFVILSLPAYIDKLRHIVLAEVEGIRWYTLFDRLLLQVFQIFSYMSSCLNIVYYILWSRNFRREALRLMCFCQKEKRRYRSVKLHSCREMKDGKRSTHIIEKSTNQTERVTMFNATDNRIVAINSNYDEHV